MGYGTLYYVSINQSSASLRPRLGAGCTCWAHRGQRPPIIIAEEKAEYQHRIVDLEIGGSEEDKKEIDALALAVVEIDREKNRIRGELNA